MRCVFHCLIASLTVFGGLCSSLEANVIDGSRLIPDIMIPYEPPSKANYTRPDLVRRQQAGRCGPDFGEQICSNDQCCSFFGYCGLGQDHCSQIASCQPAYGWCEGEPLPTTSVPPTPTPTPTPTTSSTSTVLPPSGTIISTNGMCGNSTVCTGSGFGQCCSPYWYCGNSADYCGVGCNPLFGSCSGGGISSSSSTIILPPTTSTTSTTFTTSSSSIPPVVTTTSRISSSTIPTPTPTPTPTPGGLPTTRDGTCGNGFSCNGWADGPCCSRFGYWYVEPLYSQARVLQSQFQTSSPSHLVSMGFEDHANLFIAEVTTSTAAASWDANSSSGLVILPNKTWFSNGLGLGWRIVGF